MSPFDIAKRKKELEALEKQTLEESFWNDSKNSSKVLGEIKAIKTNRISRIRTRRRTRKRYIEKYQ